MTHYLDIHLLPDPEFAPHQLMATLYAKLHRALVHTGANTLGVCFPGYDKTTPRLGTQLRLVGPTGDLARLMEQDWLSGLRDHINVSTVAAVPTHALHQSLRRVQVKSNVDRIRRRQMKRHGLTEAQARERVPDTVVEMLRLPFIQLASSSTGQTFRMYLRLSEPQPNAIWGTFNSYGLSATATVPCF